MKIALLCGGFFMLGVVIGSISYALLGMANMSKKIFYELIFMDDEVYRQLQQAVKREKEKMGLMKGRD